MPAGVRLRPARCGLVRAAGASATGSWYYNGAHDGAEFRTFGQVLMRFGPDGSPVTHGSVIASAVEPTLPRA